MSGTIEHITDEYIDFHSDDWNEGDDFYDAHNERVRVFWFHAWIEGVYEADFLDFDQYELTGTDSAYFELEAVNVEGSYAGSYVYVNIHFVDGHTLDYETKSHYSFTITTTTATDSRESYEFTVDLGNVVESSFVNLESRYSFAENNDVQDLLFTVEVFEDGVANSSIRYSLEGAHRSQFSITSSGEVFSVDSFNYESQSVYNLTVVIETDDSAGVSRVLHRKDVVVYVTDVNDVESSFIHLESRYSFAENNDVQDSLFMVEVFEDGVTNSSIRYSLEGVHRSQFSITSSGEVFSVDSFNYESQSVYNLTVVVETDDSAGVSRVLHRKDVVVYVTDVNDVAPVFTSSATYTVREDFAVGTSRIFQVVTVDIDSPVITYAIVGEDGNYLNIGSTSGDVWFATSSLDYDVKSVYEFTIVATEGRHIVSQNVTVHIEAMNLFAPVFDMEVAYDIIENVDVSSAVFVSHAQDGDNSSLTYSLGGSDGHLFRIDATSGEVYFVSSPDYESGKTVYNIEVMVSDSLFTDSENVTLNILDENENVVLRNPIADMEVDEGSIGWSLTIPEDAFFDSEGGDLTYTLIALSSDNAEVNSSLIQERRSDGSVLINVPYVTKDVSLNILVIASDGESYAVDSFKLLVNDVAPVFTSSDTYTVREDFAVDTSRIFQVVTVDIDPFSPAITYTIIGEDANYFVMNSRDVWFSSSLDYDVKSVYEFIIVATYGGHIVSQNVTVHIEAMNLSAPVFDMEVAYDIIENVDVSSAVFVSHAQDDDDNSSLTYSLGGSDGHLFRIDATSGEVYFVSSPDYESGKTVYNIEVMVSDSLFTDSENVTLNILDENENVVLRNPIADMEVDEGSMGWSLTIPGDAFFDPEGVTLTYTLIASSSDNAEVNSSLIQERHSDGSVLIDLPNVTKDVSLDILVIASDGENYAVDSFDLLVVNVDVV